MPWALPIALSAFLLSRSTGCHSYCGTPGGPAPIGEMTASSIAEKWKVVPKGLIPAALVIVRGQEGRFLSRSVAGMCRGGISIVTADDVENPEDAGDRGVA